MGSADGSRCDYLADHLSLHRHEVDGGVFEAVAGISGGLPFAFPLAEQAGYIARDAD